jgi:hypothetical protein
MQKGDKEVYFDMARKRDTEHKIKYPGKNTLIIEHISTVLCTHILQYLTQLSVPCPNLLKHALLYEICLLSLTDLLQCAEFDRSGEERIFHHWYVNFVEHTVFSYTSRNSQVIYLRISCMIYSK